MPADTLDPNNWNPNRVHLAEVAAPRTFAALYRLVATALVNPDRLIIDRFHRWRLSQDSQAVRTGWSARSRTRCAAGFTGWTLAELAVLNRHRRLAM